MCFCKARIFNEHRDLSHFDGIETHVTFIQESVPDKAIRYLWKRYACVRMNLSTDDCIDIHSAICAFGVPACGCVCRSSNRKCHDQNYTHFGPGYVRSGSTKSSVLSEVKSAMPRSELNSLSTRLGAIRLREEFSSVRVQVGKTTIRVKLTFDQARCHQAPGRV